MKARTSKLPALVIIIAILTLAIAVSYIKYEDSYRAPFRVENRNLNGMSILYETFKELDYEVHNNSYELTEENSGKYDVEIIANIKGTSDFSVLDESIYSWLNEGGNLMVLMDGIMDLENVSTSLVYSGVESEIDGELGVLHVGEGTISYINIASVLNLPLTVDSNSGYELFEKIHGAREDVVSINFNEYYFYGNEPGLSLWKDIPMSVKLVFFQIVILIFVYIAYKGRRFGKIKKYYDEEERTENEYINAVTNLYNKSGNGTDIIKKYEDRSEK